MPETTTPVRSRSVRRVEAIIAAAYRRHFVVEERFYGSYRHVTIANHMPQGSNFWEFSIDAQGRVSASESYRGLAHSGRQAGQQIARGHKVSLSSIEAYLEVQS
jgi:hypothetical protein